MPPCKRGRAHPEDGLAGPGPSSLAQAAALGDVLQVVLVQAALLPEFGQLIALKRALRLASRIVRDSTDATITALSMPPLKGKEAEGFLCFAGRMGPIRELRLGDWSTYPESGILYRWACHPSAPVMRFHEIPEPDQFQNHSRFGNGPIPIRSRSREFWAFVLIFIFDWGGWGEGRGGQKILLGPGHEISCKALTPAGRRQKASECGTARVRLSSLVRLLVPPQRAAGMPYGGMCVWCGVGCEVMRGCFVGWLNSSR
jgi:hypothetical protein